MSPHSRCNTKEGTRPTATTKKLWTYDDYAALDDGRRYEVIEGELIEMSSPNTRHQRILLRLTCSLAAFVEDNTLGEVFIALFDVVLSPINVLQPDVMFISNANSDMLTSLNVQGAPDSCVEILSPSTSARDRREKLRLYREFGVREYWLVDPDTETITVLTLEDGTYAMPVEAVGETLMRSLALPGFASPAAAFFPA